MWKPLAAVLSALVAGQAVCAAGPAAPLLKPTDSTGVEIEEGKDEIEFRSAWLRLTVARQQPRITLLSWDSLGKGERPSESAADGGSVRRSVERSRPGGLPGGACPARLRGTPGERRPL